MAWLCPRNKAVPAGDLIVKGTSLDAANSDCTVYVSLNDLEPFQKATANGPGGQNDYSSWTFTYTKEYHQIAQGPNKLTARLSCPNSEAHSSVDIVGTLLPPGVLLLGVLLLEVLLLEVPLILEVLLLEVLQCPMFMMVYGLVGMLVLVAL